MKKQILLLTALTCSTLTVCAQATLLGHSITPIHSITTRDWLDLPISFYSLVRGADELMEEGGYHRVLEEDLTWFDEAAIERGWEILIESSRELLGRGYLVAEEIWELRMVWEGYIWRKPLSGGR